MPRVNRCIVCQGTSARLSHRQHRPAQAFRAEALEDRRLFDGVLYSPEVLALPASAGNFKERVADLNGDHAPDLVVTSGTRNVAVLLNRGGDAAGAFAPAVISALLPSGTLFDFNIGDLDGDGDIDLVGTSTAGVISTRLNDGHGSFGAAISSTPAGVAPSEIGVGDLTGDGRADLVLAGDTGTQPGVAAVAVYTGNGDGTFAATATSLQTVVTSTATIDFVTLADLDADNDLDIVGGNFASVGTLATFLNNGSGSISAGTTYAGGKSSENVLVADVTGDGRVDLVVGDMNQYSLRVLPGTGGGAFNASSPVIYPNAFDGDTIAAGDLNGDGRADVISRSLSSAVPIAFLGTATGLVQPAGPTDAQLAGGTGWRPATSAISDLNGDGKGDLAVLVSSRAGLFNSTTLNATLTLAFGDGSGSFYVPSLLNDRRFDLPRGSGMDKHATLIDVDGDGFLDAVDLSHADSNFRVAWGLGDGRFDAATTFSAPSASLYSDDVTFADVDGDGLLDAIWGTGAAENASLRVSLNAGNRIFAPSILTAGPLAAKLIVEDFDGDGRDDLLSVGNGATKLLSNGDGTFTRSTVASPYSTTATSIIITDAALADISGDGIKDLVVSVSINHLDPVVTASLGTTGGSFDAPVFSTINVSRPGALRAADFDSDGISELLVLYFAAVPSGQAIIKWNGSSLVVASQLPNPSAATTPSEVAPLVADADADGDLDLFYAALTNRNFVEVRLNRGDGTFEPARFFHRNYYNYLNTAAADAIAVGDIDCDGKPDLVAFEGDHFSALINRQIVAADAVAPALSIAAFDPSGFRPVVRVTSSEPLAVGSVSAADLTITNLTTGQTFVATKVLFGDGNRSLSFQLPVGLSDGHYRLTLAAGAMSDIAGNPSAAVTLDNAATYVLAGDADRDHAVGFGDLIILAQSYGQVGKTFSQGNFDYSPDGKVDFNDLVILAQHYKVSAALFESLKLQAVAPSGKASYKPTKRPGATVLS